MQPEVTFTNNCYVLT